MTCLFLLVLGVEFLMSTNAFYCTLCKEFSGDVLSAEAHLKSGGHNMTYQVGIYLAWQLPNHWSSSLSTYLLHISGSHLQQKKETTQKELFHLRLYFMYLEYFYQSVDCLLI